MQMLREMLGRGLAREPFGHGDGVPGGGVGRHRVGGLFGFGWPKGPRVPMAVSGGVALVVLLALVLRIVSANASGCTGGVQLRIAATPEIAPALSDIAADWMSSDPKVAGECINAIVDPTAPATIASRLTVYAGRGIEIAGPAEPTPSEDALPAVWVPDSTAWVVRVEEIDGAAFTDRPQSIVSSPLVLAMPEAAARAVGWPDSVLPVTKLRAQLASGAIRLGLSEPRRDSAGLATAMILAADAIATSDDEVPALMSTLRGVVKTTSTGELLRTFSDKMTAGLAAEQAVLAFDGSGPPAKLVPVTLEPVTPVLDYPYAIRSGISQKVAQAAAMFHDVLGQAPAMAKLAARGFRTPDGQLGPGFPSSSAKNQNPQTVVAITDPNRIQQGLDLWTAANSPARAALMLDLTSSMTLPAADGTQSRVSVMAAAARQALDLLGPASQVGLWTFAAVNQKVLPIDDLTGDQRTDFDQRLGSLGLTGGDQASLYAVLLAGYQAMKDGFDPGRPNLMIVLTDGGDGDASDLALAKFDQSVQILADPTKPIRVVLVGIGANSPDAARLAAIAHVVGGGYAPLSTPAQIRPILLSALLQAIPSHP